MATLLLTVRFPQMYSHAPHLHIFRYSIGNSRFTSRPPTGVDLALGLNGYDKLKPPEGPARLPSSLQPLEDTDDIEKVRRRMARREVEDMRSDFCDIRFNQFTF
jgi:hypothetical protein